MNQTFRLGIDIGSTTVKTAVLDNDNQILFADYERHYANTRRTLAALLKKAAKGWESSRSAPASPAPADWPFPVI